MGSRVRVSSRPPTQIESPSAPTAGGLLLPTCAYHSAYMAQFVPPLFRGCDFRPSALGLCTFGHAIFNLPCPVCFGRVIVPGYFGGKNVKWLDEIKLSNEESMSTWQRGIAYKGLSNNIKSISDIDKSTINNIPTIEELPVQSIICDVIEGDNDIVTIKGIAYSGGGKKIVRVDVSINGGTYWNTAELGEGKDQERNRAWAWTFWEISLPKNDTMEIISKATDSSYNTQPDNINNIWNIRGILNNSVFKYIEN